MSESYAADEQLSPTKRALLELKSLRARLNALERARTEPIAIVGAGCRFPGEAHDPETFWHNLENGVHAIGEIPKDRWDVDAYYDPDPNAPGKMVTRRGGFLRDVDQFDAAFFGITPREAKGLDPQQRLLLEVSWEALERAAIKPDGLEGSQTGVYFGVMLYDYGQRYLHQPDATAVDAYYASGTDTSFAAGRVSYILGLQGPSMTLNTVCSSSLVAVHLACQSLRAGETDLALAGGVNVITSPEMYISLSRMGALSPDGVSKTFDAAANGYVRSEGCGIVVLKRLSDALADGDPILALIRGTAVNHDGPSGGLTVPNSPAQQALIRRALQNAGVAPHQISYVEAHGTGTPLGDPIEIKALHAVLNEGRSPEQPLMIGSVKTNIGHLESAAGVAGLIKVALALHHQAIPPHLHLQQVNQAIGLEEMPVIIPTTLTPWPAGETPRLAGVSSFGLSGINAHIVMEEAPPPPAVATPAVARPHQLLTLSAKSDAALQVQAAQWAHYLATHADLSLADVCYTLHQARAHFNHRLSLVAASPAEAAVKLREINEGKAGEGISCGQADGEQGAIAFLFPGQGGQFVGMARELYETHSGFRQTVDECAELVQPYLARPLLSVIYPQPDESSPLDEMEYAQPAMFTIEYALAKLWQSWGVQADVLLGHSLGEYVAACLAGVFSLTDGLKLVAERGRLMQYETEPGWMVVVFADEEQVQAALAPYSREAGIAAVNGPRNVTISGRGTAVQAVMQTLATKGIQTRRLNIPHASHSPLMEPILAAYTQTVAGTTRTRPSLAVVSNVTGQIAGAEMVQPEYWAAHMRQPVRFADGIHCLQQQGVTIYIEMGPKPTLLGMGQRMAGAGTWLPSLRPKRGDWQQILESVGALITQGVEVDRASLGEGYSGRRLALPTYPFQRQRYWLSVKSGARPTQVTLPEPPQPDWLYELQWQAQPLPETSEPGKRGCWLIFADQGGVGQALAGRLKTAGETATLVWPGEAWASTAVDQYHLDPTQPDHYTRLLQENEGTAPWQGVIYLWGLDTGPVSSLDQLFQAQERGCHSVLHLVQAMAQSQQDGRARLWLVTRGAQFTGKEAAPIQVEQSPLWGFGRVIALEQPDLWGGLMDLPPLSDVTTALATQVDQLLAQIRCPDAENQVVFRDGARFVPRLIRSTPGQNHKSLTIQADGIYLVTGGLGNLGLEVARWLVRQGARRLILTSRSGLPSVAAGAETPVLSAAQMQQMETIQALRAQGIQVQVARADVADWDQMVALFTELENGPPLRGVIHAAGVVTAHTVTEMPTAVLQAALQAKVTGTWVLHQLSHMIKAPLDFFVMFSSGASVWGSQKMAHYAAANHFLDGMAHYRRALGLPALSVNWGWWDGQGIVSDDLAQFFAQIGLTGMAAPAALDTLRYLLETDATQQTVAAIEWSRFKPIYELRGQQPLLEQIAVTSPTILPLAMKTANSLVSQIKAAASAEKWELLLGHVRQQVAAVIGADSPDLLDADQGFFAMGMDSIMTVELRNQLEASLTCSLPPTVAFEYPTIHDLAAFLARDVLQISVNGNGKAGHMPPPEMKTKTKSNEQTSNNWDGLSEEELLSLVDSELLTISELV